MVFIEQYTCIQYGCFESFPFR